MNDDLLLDDQCMLILHDFADLCADSRLVRAYLNKIIELAEHICLLSENRDLIPTRTLAWHIKIDPLGGLYAWKLRQDRQVIDAHRLINYLNPLYAEAKRRYERKASWMRDGR